MKKIDENGLTFLYKEKCTLRGDLQESFQDYDPENVYALVAAHETIRMLFSIETGKYIILEGFDISKAYLDGYMDVRIVMEQITDYSGHLAVLDHYCILEKSLYGAKQAGGIWGTLLHEKLTNWGFHQ